MLSSCQSGKETQQALTKSNGRSTRMVTHVPAITILQMCRAMPAVFRVGRPASKPSQTLEQWAALGGMTVTQSLRQTIVAV